MSVSAPDAVPDFRVLGPLRVVRGEHEIDLRGDKPRTVLALLLLRRRRLVPGNVFADEIWGRDLAVVQANLQVLVSQLRRALAAADAGPGADQRFIRTTPGGYVIVVDDENYDLARFQQLRDKGNAARAAGDAAAAARNYAAAIAQWSGERALEDLAGAPFADAFAQAMEQELLGVLDARVAADLACGRHGEVLGELSVLARRYPLNHAFCGHLLLALARSGRSADAAREYHEFRARYEQELDAPPPHALRQIWGAVARGEDHLGGYGPAAPAAGVQRTLVDDGPRRPTRRARVRHRRPPRGDRTGHDRPGRLRRPAAGPEGQQSSRGHLADPGRIRHHRPAVDQRHVRQRHPGRPPPPAGSPRPRPARRHRTRVQNGPSVRFVR